jgi:plasmid maintenance system antidote protein VapI
MPEIVVYTPEDVARILQISVRQVKELINMHKMDSVRISRKITRVTDAQLAAYLTQQSGELVRQKRVDQSRQKQVQLPGGNIPKTPGKVEMGSVAAPKRKRPWQQ